MATDAFLTNVTRQAMQHVNETEDRLAVLVDAAWVDARLFDNSTWGPRKEFWDKVRTDILTRASKERESVGALTAMLTHDVVQWAEHHGFPTAGYEYPFGLLVAWLTVAALKRPRGRDDKQKKD